MLMGGRAILYPHGVSSWQSLVKFMAGAELHTGSLLGYWRHGTLLSLFSGLICTSSGTRYSSWAVGAGKKGPVSSMPTHLRHVDARYAVAALCQE